MFYLILTGIIYIYKRFLAENKYITSFSPTRLFLLIIVFQTIYTSIVYTINFENLQVSEPADAYYYMYPQLYDEAGNFSISVFSNYLFSFRGYFFAVISILFNCLSKIIKVDVMYFYFIYFAVIVAFTIVFALPKLFSVICKKNAKNHMCILMYVLFVIFWGELLYYALTDIPAAMFGLCAIAYGASAVREWRRKDYTLCGIFIGLATSYRASYEYVFWLLIAIFLISVVNKCLYEKRNIKEYVLNIVFFILGLLIITWPQAYLNYIRGHMGIFPFSGPWVHDISSNSYINDTLYSFWYGLHTYVFGGMQNADWQLVQIDQLFYTDKFYSIGDILYIIFANPVEFAMGYFKKLFWAMSAGREKVYGSPYIIPYFEKVLPLLNYWIVGNFIYAAVKKEKRELFPNGLGRLFCGIALVTIVLQALMHIERRYYLLYYLLLYFYNSFVLVEYYTVRNSENLKLSTNYKLTITIFILFCYTIRELFRYNFI